MHRLAQVNVARMRGSLTDPVMRGFVDALEPVNRLAEASAGFVWRLAGAHEHEPSVRTDGTVHSVVNVSVWVDYPSLHAFTYRSPHGAYLRRRATWFLATPPPSTALWWVEADTRPSAEDALRRLDHLRRHGPSPRAFTVRHRYTADGRRERTRAPRLDIG